MPYPSDRELFPKLFSGSSQQNSRRAYHDIVMKELNEIALAYNTYCAADPSQLTEPVPPTLNEWTDLSRLTYKQAVLDEFGVTADELNNIDSLGKERFDEIEVLDLYYNSNEYEAYEIEKEKYDAAKSGYEAAKNKLADISGSLNSAWVRAERKLCASILDGTVDSFPELWISNGTVVKTKDGKKVELAVDFFRQVKRTSAEAKACSQSALHQLGLAEAPEKAAGPADSAPMLRGILETHETADFFRTGGKKKGEVDASFYRRLVIIALLAVIALHIILEKLSARFLIAGFLFTMMGIVEWILGLGLVILLLPLVMSLTQVPRLIKEALQKHINKKHARAANEEAMKTDAERLYRVVRYFWLWKKELKDGTHRDLAAVNAEGRNVGMNCYQEMKNVVMEIDMLRLGMDR